MDSIKCKNRTYIGTRSSEHSAVEMPDLIAIQLDSYARFLQKEKIGTNDGPDPNYGLESVFRSVFPVTVGNYELIYRSYRLDFDDPNQITKYKLDEKECKRRGLIHSVPVKVKFLLVDKTNEHDPKESEVYLGDIPLMTSRGGFIINGVEKVVVTQIHRSPGVIAQKDKGVYSSRIIPTRGSWLEFEMDDKHEGIYTKIDRKKRILATVFLRSIGLSGREDIVSVFYLSSLLSLKNAGDNKIQFNNLYSYKNYYDSDNVKIIRAGDRIDPTAVDHLVQSGYEEIEVIDFNNPKGLGYDTIIKCFEKEEKDNLIDRENGEDEPSEAAVLHEVLSGIQRSEMIGSEKAKQDLCDMFFNPKNYDLGEVGRYKFNSKFYPGENNPDALVDTTLRIQDIVETMKYLINVFNGKEPIDDIDHLGHRRVRCVGELLENSLRAAFSKNDKALREKMTQYLGQGENFAGKDIIKELLSNKVITPVIKEFFQRSQLCQFMDQINPLAELTNKRRVTALGPGGLNRERASFEVRDVHYSHYGRMCPIETPEGQNIGLILTLANYTKITEHGFLETPYRKVVGGVVTNEVEYLDADEEEHYYIAQASAELNDDGTFVDNVVPVRKKGDYTKQKPLDIEYMDVSPRQVISVASSLIPFLEHDDGNRALMGANMQRQAVPLLFPEAPRVGTGMEEKAAYDSGVVVKAKRAGTVTYVSSTMVKITPDDAKNKKETDTYLFEKNSRTNQNTCFTQKPIVSHSEHVEAGQVIADGPATDGGELALGRNILVGFVPWNGYNYEDAVLISERVVKEDIYSSVHIEEFTIEVRDNKLGREMVTRDLPNETPEHLAHLDENGIVRIGTFVQSGDILVGKTTPKSESDSMPEIKLISAIFGSKSNDLRNTSLLVPHGTSGTVIGIDRLGREDNNAAQADVIETIKVQIANKRKLRPGDKMAGRHGNKGVVSRILPVEDMPYMEDGTPLDVCLNPLGVPSRMNIGQLMETELGWAAVKLDEWYRTPVFQSASMEQIEEKMKKAELPVTSKRTLYDGRTGERFVNDVFCGYIYYLKLDHLVDDKIHARSTGPYSLVTQQPLGGRANFGGQRFGEMEVWALEAYGAVNTLQEILTIKSDDMEGRVKAYHSIVKGELTTSAGTPEAFSVLLQEVRGLCLDMQVYDSNGKEVHLTERDEELIRKRENREAK